MPEPSGFKVHLQHTVNHRTEPSYKDQYAMLPHEVFHSLHKYAPDLFRELFGTDEELRNWWALASHAAGTWYNDHPVIRDVHDPTRRIPFGMHGDDAGTQGGTKC